MHDKDFRLKIQEWLIFITTCIYIDIFYHTNMVYQIYNIPYLVKRALRSFFFLNWAFAISFF